MLLGLLLCHLNSTIVDHRSWACRHEDVLHHLDAHQEPAGLWGHSETMVIGATEVDWFDSKKMIENKGDGLDLIQRRRF